MEKKDFSVITRRDFIRRAACAAVGTAAMTSAIRDLRFMNAAVAQSNIGPNDYKALVCVFLQGGNDSNNLDRKSTRLNSSHLGISYAVFCLKKKKKKRALPCITSLWHGRGWAASIVTR